MSRFETGRIRLIYSLGNSSSQHIMSDKGVFQQALFVPHLGHILSSMGKLKIIAIPEIRFVRQSDWLTDPYRFGRSEETSLRPPRADIVVRKMRPRRRSIEAVAVVNTSSLEKTEMSLRAS